MMAELQTRAQAQAQAAQPQSQAPRLSVVQPAAAPERIPAMAGAAAAPAFAPGVDPSDPGTWGASGRNDPCPCGSGKKYKHCHGKV